MPLPKPLHIVSLAPDPWISAAEACSHPAEDSTVLFLKATFLMGRIGRLTRRIQIRRSMGQPPKMSTSEFQRLARDVSDFR